MLTAVIQKNDAKAKWLIGIFSVVVFAVVVLLGKIKLEVSLGFNIHVFALANAIINSTIALLLIAAIMAVKKGHYQAHKRLMMSALILSILFLLSYISHHLLAGETKYGDANFDGNTDAAEIAAVGAWRLIYFLILATHIILATLTLPFILYTAYKGLTAEFTQHKKISKIIFPLWLYVAITGPIVYLMISPFYH